MDMLPENHSVWRVPGGSILLATLLIALGVFVLLYDVPAAQGREPSAGPDGAVTPAPTRFDLTLTFAGDGEAVVWLESDNDADVDIVCNQDDSPCVLSASEGAQVKLTAWPDASSLFNGWSGACFGDAQNCFVTMDQARSATATFTRKQFTLSVTKSGAGLGAVTVSPPGAGCAEGADCTTVLPYGTNVTLTAATVPDSGSHLSGWSDPCFGSQEPTCTFLLLTAMGVEANFTRDVYALNVAILGEGRVESAPGGIICIAASAEGCTASFAHGTSVTLTATPDSDTVFAKWEGDCTGSDLCEVSMTEARSVTARFHAANLPPGTRNVSYLPTVFSPASQSQTE